MAVIPNMIEHTAQQTTLQIAEERFEFLKH